uniref:RNA-directed RNA polymerase n=1 Tax=Changjiang levi-like virus 2 TaxID=1922774 RepID=A0A1L3KID9_9VIRU|nr:hypothetical protein [Changjiang levi-like virus 2]
MSRTPSRPYLTGSTLQQAVDRICGNAASRDAVTADAFAMAYWRERYLSKHEEGADVEKLSHACVTTFKEVESENSETNKRLCSLSLSGPALFCLSEARMEIKRLLGRFRLDEFWDSCDWGPGATATLVAEDATLDKKILESQLSVSRRALPWARAALQWDSHWFAARTGTFPEGPYSVLANNFFVREHERFTTVPKDKNKRRAISIQNTMNLFLQKGLGAMVRRRLKRVGVDLDDQSRNQWLASIAYKCWLSTIDLAHASDSVCYELVRFLLPEEWFDVFCQFRQGTVAIGEDVHVLNRFSAMGNGYTFELESLIFWGLITSVMKRFDLIGIHAVYGDDIIVENNVSSAVISLLHEVGFTVNVDKTFTEGFFYESCGKHYFAGHDVTPPYQKEEIRCLPSLIRCANRLFRYACRVGSGKVPDLRVHQVWTLVVTTAFSVNDAINARRWENWADGGFRGREPAPLPFPFIPHWLGDDFGLLWPEPFQSRNGFVNFDRLTFEPIRHTTDGWSLYSNLLRKGGCTETASYGRVDLRGRTLIGRGRGKTPAASPTVDWPDDWPLKSLDRASS